MPTLSFADPPVSAAPATRGQAPSLPRTGTALVVARPTPPTSNRSFRSKKGGARHSSFRAPRTNYTRSLLEAQRWGGVALGSVFSLVVQQLPELAAIAFLGRIGVSEVASVSLSSVWAYGVARILWIGLSLGQGALVSQAAGSRQYSAVYGWTLLRLIADLVLGITVTIPMFLCTHLLLAKLGFESVDLTLVQEYLLASLPVPLMVSFIETMSVHLSAIQRVWQTVVCEVLYGATDILFSYLFILGNETLGIPQLGAKGAAYANILSCGLCLILYSIFFLMGASMPPEHAENDEEGHTAGGSHSHSRTQSRKASGGDAESFSFLPGSATPSYEDGPLLKGVAEEGPHAHDHEEDEEAADEPDEDEDEDDLEEVDETVKAAASFRLHGKLGSSVRNTAPVSLAAEVSIATLPVLLEEPLLRKKPTALVIDAIHVEHDGDIDINDDAVDGDGADGEEATAPPVILTAGPTGDLQITHEAAVKRVNLRSVLRFIKRKKNITTFAIQAGASTLSMAFEIGQEIMLSSFAAGLGTVQVACHNALAEAFELGGMVFYGAGQATSIRIGSFLGAAKVAAAKRVVWVAGAIVVVWTLLATGVVGAVRNDVGKLFSTEPAFVDTADQVVPYFLISYVSYGAYIHLSSVLDGQGRARLYPILSFVGCILVTAVLSVISLKVTDFGLRGLWGAEAIGNAVSALLALYFVARSDWRELSVQAIERSGAESPLRKTKSTWGPSTATASASGAAGEHHGGSTITMSLGKAGASINGALPPRLPPPATSPSSDVSELTGDASFGGKKQASSSLLRIGPAAVANASAHGCR